MDGQHDKADGCDDDGDVGGDVIVRREGSLEVGIVVVEDAAEHQHGENGKGEHEREHDRLTHEQLHLHRRQAQK